MADPIVTVDPRSARGYTNALLEMVDDGMMDKDVLLQELLLWMSEHEVQDFCQRSLLLRDDDNECVIREEEEEECEE